MSAFGKISRLLIVFVAIVILATNGQVVLADSYGDRTYFEDRPGTDFLIGGYIDRSTDNGVTPGLIDSGYAGSTPQTGFFGFVMPNWESNNTSKDGGGGAVGVAALKKAYKAHTGEDLDIDDTDKERAMREKKRALLYFLQDRHKNEKSAADDPEPTDEEEEGSKWDKMGSAVVVRTLLGSKFDDPGRNRSRDISDEEWEELERRLLNENITMNHEKSTGHVNSAGVISQDAHGNIVFDAIQYHYTNPYNVDSWVFRDTTLDPTDDRDVIYRIEIICANPLGVLPGLPPAPPKDYSLTPSVSTDGKSSVEPGGEIVITGTVNNPSDNPSNETEWRLTRIVYGAGPNPTSTRGTTNASGVDTPDTRDPCSFFDPAGRIPPPCEAIESGTGRVFDPKVVATVVNELKYDVPNDVEIGTEICFALSVKPPTHEAAHRDRWRHSDLSCVMVSKSPKVQIWGGDVRVGGSIDVSSRDYTTPSPVTYGSWGEYGVLSGEVDTVPPVGVNSGFASGSGLSGGNADSSQSSWSALTFANTGTVALCDFGCYNFTISSSALVEQFVVATTMTLGGNVNLDTLGSGTYRATGPVTLTPTTVGSGKSIIILSDHEITIEGDITYSNGPYTNLRDIPQVVLRAPTINIKNGAGVVDAWLFAVATGRSGVLNTCSDVAISANLSSNMCNNPLRVNGPVVADKLYLRRTAGSDGNSGDRSDPAEVFNLRADAYLWANGYSSGKSQARTVYVKELPPRF